MDTVTSHDGTRIAFDRIGAGPPIVAVVGAFNDRWTAEPLARFLAPHFSVLTYDRRGRGDSGDTAPYALEREVEDLAALIVAAGGSAGVFGFSSGAVLALEAAARGLHTTRLALYEAPPFGSPVEHAAILADLVAAGRRGDAVEYFQRDVVGIPADVVGQMRHAPVRPGLEAMAHTLVYDMRILGDTSLLGRLASIAQPTLVISGQDSMNGVHDTASALVTDLPNARHRVVNGLHHNLVPEAIGPLLVEFFGG
jgi:pimeloyl-ACP methyl ester carboxylesterase